MIAKFRVCLVLAVFSTLMALGFERLPAGHLLSLKGHDLQHRLFSDPEDADKRIILVEVDQASLDFFEEDNIPFPWPRSIYAPLVKYCIDGGAKAVVFDILFNNSSPWGEAVDEEFASAIAPSGRVTLAAAFTGGEPDETTVLPQRFTLSFSGSAPENLNADSASLPVPPLLASAGTLGSVSLTPDVDGTIRRIRPFVVYDGDLVPSLAIAPLFEGLKDASFHRRSLSLGALSIPLDSEGKMWIRFHGPRGGYRRISAADVISSAVRASTGDPVSTPMEIFNDAYVIVGYSAHGLYDLKPTPLSGSSPGTEINAAALDNFLNGNFLRRAPEWAGIAFSASVALLLAAATLFTVSAWSTAPFVIPVTAGSYGLLSAAFEAGYVLNLMTVVVAAFLSILGAGAYKYHSEGRQRRFISSVLSRYVSPKVVRQVLANPEKLALGGEKKTATLFFSDLEGFTSITEQSDPRRLVSLLNEYTTFMEEVITSRDGTLDKYIGDAVMAFWGAPVAQADNARLAVLAALECQAKMKVFAKRVKDEGGPALGVRIGLNTGPCIIGNMGSKNRFDYTAIGDAVNQAARLESLNKFYKTTVMASAATWEAAGDAAFGRFLDYVCVKGKREPIRIYEVMALGGQENEDMIFLKEHYEKALLALHSRDWEGTLALTHSILERCDDHPSRVIRERAKTCALTPPPDAWDGALTHTSK